MVLPWRRGPRCVVLCSSEGAGRMTQIVRLLVAELFLLSHEEGVHWVLLPVALKNTKKSPCFLRRMYELPPEAITIPPRRNEVP